MLIVGRLAGRRRLSRWPPFGIIFSFVTPDHSGWGILMIKKILIAYDGSGFAKKAFDMGLQLAQFYHASVVVVSVTQLPEPAMIYETTELLDDARVHYEKEFAGLRAAAQAAGVHCETQVVVGHVADQIVQQATAENADVIVMGHRGKGIIERWMLGSVSKRVISYAHCSVLVVR
jgi:nucleotide-binding universal stress UspA family protein